MSNTHNCLTPVRVDVKTTCRLSGAHDGCSFSPSVVNGLGVPPRTGIVRS
jgi:hypothetical protein